MSNSVTLPPPYSGVDEQNPIQSVKHPYCEYLMNFNTTSAGIALRNGDSTFDTFTRPSISNTNMGLFAFGNSKLIVPIKASGADIRFYDAETGVNGYTTGAPVNTSAWTSMYFMGRLYFFPDTTTLMPGVYWDGAAFGATGYTGATTFSPIAGAVYNHRAYMIQRSEAAYWYSEIDSVTGACTKVDLSGIIEQSATLSSIASFTLSDQVTTESLLAFVFSDGQILFYSGPYPNSPTWSLRGKTQVGQPLYVNSIIRYQGDSLLMCDSGVISLRALFLADAENARNLSANARMQQTWKTLVQAIRNTLSTPNGPITPGDENGIIRGVYDSKNNRIIVSFPYITNNGTSATNGSFFFIYNTLLESWFYHQSASKVYDIAIYKNKTLLLGMKTDSTSVIIWEKEGATGFTDRNTSDSGELTYTYDFISAPIPFAKTASYNTDGIEPIIESDLYSQTNWNLISDFGKQTSSNQNISDTMATTVSKPLVNAGMHNITYVQVEMSGTTAASKTVGLKLYGYNIWYNSGEKGSR